MVSRNPHELQSRNDIWLQIGVKSLFEQTRKVFSPKRQRPVKNDENAVQASSAKEVQLKVIHQNAQLLGIFISLDAHSRLDNQIRDALKKLLKSFATANGMDDSTVIELRNITLLSLLNEDEQAIVEKWLSQRSIRMDDLFTRTLGEIADFLAQKSADGSLKTSRNTPVANTNNHSYSSREKTTQLLFKNFSEATINEMISPDSLRDLYSRVSASAHSI